MTALKIPTDVRGLKFVEQASWAAGDPGSGYTSLRAKDIKFVPEVKTHFAEYQKSQPARGFDQPSIGGKGGKLTFQVPMRGGAATANSEFMLLAKNIGDYGQALTAIGDGGTVSAPTFGAVDTWAPGYGVGIRINEAANEDVEVRFVGSVTSGATDTVNLSHDLSSVSGLGNSNTIKTSSITANPANIIGEPTKYLTFKFYEGSGSTNVIEWSLTGCVVSNWKLMSASVDTVPWVEFTVMCDSWSTAATALAQAADTWQTPYPLIGSPCHIKVSPINACSFLNAGDKVVHAHTVVNTDRVMFVPGRGTLPVALEAGRIYYVVSAGSGYFSVSATSGGSAITLASDADTATGYYVDIDGAASATLAIESIELDAGLKVEPLLDPNGANGRSGWVNVGCAPKFKIKPYFDSDWIDRWQTGTQMSIALSSVKDTNEFWGLWVPCVYISKYGEGDISGLTSAEVEFTFGDPGTATNHAGSTVYLPLWSVCCSAT